MSLLSNIQDTLKTLNDCVEKSAKEVHQAKADAQKMRLALQSETAGRYIRDDHRIILSAPEILIGDLSPSGVLNTSEGYSVVVVRGNNVRLEGVGNANESIGSVVTRASSIRQIAVDPGADGIESAVMPISEVVTKARSIALDSEQTVSDEFVRGCRTMAGVSISSDTGLLFSANQAVETDQKTIEDRLKELEGKKSTIKNGLSDLKKNLAEYTKELQAVLDKDDKIPEDDDGLRSDLTSQYRCTMALEYYLPKITSAYDLYYGSLSALAEVCRKIKALKESKAELNKKKGDFKTKPNFNAIDIKSEMINIISMDGDGNIRADEGSQIHLQAQNITLESKDAKGALDPKSHVKVAAQDIQLTTANPKIDYDAKTAEMPAVGKVTVTSKEITLEGVDYDEQKIDKPAEKEITEKALTKEGKILLRAESISSQSTDTEGKATGKIEINAKAVEVKSFDVDKEKRTDTALAAGSTTVIVSEKMLVGSRDQQAKSKQLQVASEKVAILAKDTLEAQQEKGLLQLKGGKAALSGSESAIYGKVKLEGDTTINGKAEIKGETKTPKATIDNLEAKSSFKSPNISDGIAIPGGPASAGSVSASLKEEEIKQ